MTGAVSSTMRPGAGLNLWKLKSWRPPPSQTRKTAKLIRGGAIEPGSLITADREPLPALTFYRLFWSFSRV